MPVVQSNSQNGWFATNDDELVHNAARHIHMEKSKFGRSPASIYLRKDVLRVANFEKKWRVPSSSELRDEEVVRTKNALNAFADSFSFFFSDPLFSCIA